MEMYLMTWPEVEGYLGRKKSLILPVGSTEQHGPNGLIGTDFLTAWEVAKGVGAKTQTLVASPLCYGMALHHLDFPGSAAFKPSTYIQILKEIFSSYTRAGFAQFFVINGHGGNIPSLQASFSEMLSDQEKFSFKLYNWWHLPAVMEYEKKVFGDLNGFHATCGEVSVTMATHPEAYKTERKWEYFPTAQRTAWPLSPAEMRRTFPDGRMGSDPRLSTKEHGQIILQKAIDAIAEDLRKS